MGDIVLKGVNKCIECYRFKDRTPTEMVNSFCCLLNRYFALGISKTATCACLNMKLERL